MYVGEGGCGGAGIGVSVDDRESGSSRFILPFTHTRTLTRLTGRGDEKTVPAASLVLSDE